MINYLELFIFTTFTIFGMVSALYFPIAWVEKRWPFRIKKGGKTNSGAKFG
tara:strand:- start:719 stop:871 length:153 start_codon:yes stop_codon:yes gene_type:complete